MKLYYYEIQLRMEIRNVSKRQQPDQRADLHKVNDISRANSSSIFYIVVSF